MGDGEKPQVCGESSVEAAEYDTQKSGKEKSIISKGIASV
jgi:hypothetical protein